MKCETSILEIETILSRIKDQDINLQPDFQRGEVWSLSKKRKLIDSILRGWKIPPIHLVQGENAIDEVLDGQQRLVAIRDFFNNKFEIDGLIEPFDETIFSLTNMKYIDLPVDIQRLFRKYTVHFIRLTEYKSEEPAELFYRLNQPATLTSAEQRNAYIGKTREQIKRLVDLFIDLGADKDCVGFSNSRLAYDEIISKFCYCIEIQTLRKKISANDVSDKYRYDKPFYEGTIFIAEQVLRKYMNSMNRLKNKSYIPKLSKATLYSWFIFIKTKPDMDELDISEIIYKFELSRDYLKGKVRDNLFERYSDWYKPLLNKYPFFEIMLNTYNQRSSMGSTDALSIIYRDIIINIFCEMIEIKTFSNYILNDVMNCFHKKQNMAMVLDEIYSKYEWGEIF